jgi:hypothetical protein
VILRTKGTKRHLNGFNTRGQVTHAMEMNLFWDNATATLQASHAAGAGPSFYPAIGCH